MIQQLNCRFYRPPSRGAVCPTRRRAPRKHRASSGEENPETPPQATIQSVEETRSGGGVLAGGAVGLGLGLFLATRVFTGGPSFADLEAQSVPLDLAQNNGKATVVEFYANWCEVCREMLPDTLSVEESYKSDVNFVALNVENAKWAPEMLEYGVDGIPHFEFLNSQHSSEGSAVGRLPRRVLEADIKALAERMALPYRRVIYQTSKLREPPSTMTGPQTMPRDHVLWLYKGPSCNDGGTKTMSGGLPIVSMNSSRDGRCRTAVPLVSSAIGLMRASWGHKYSPVEAVLFFFTIGVILLSPGITISSPLYTDKNVTNGCSRSFECLAI